MNFKKIFGMIFFGMCSLESTNLIAAISRLDIYLDKQLEERNKNKKSPVVFSPDNTLKAVVTPNKTIRLWNLKKRCRMHEFAGHSKCINSIAFSPDGKLLASASSDKTVRLWDVKNGNCVHVFYDHNSEVDMVVFNPMGSLLATMSFDGIVMLFDVKRNECVRVFSWPLLYFV